MAIKDVGTNREYFKAGGGAIFKRECFIFTNILPEKFDYTFMTADLAYKDKQHNDFTCFSYWGVLDKKLYLIDSKRKKIDWLINNNIEKYNTICTNKKGVYDKNSIIEFKTFLEKYSIEFSLS